jgi:hypothetical protein
MIYGCRPLKIFLFLLYHIVVCFDKYSMTRRVGRGMAQQISNSARLTHKFSQPVKTFEKGLSLSLSAETSPATAGGIGAANLTRPGKQPSGPADDSGFVRGLEDPGKYSRNGRIFLNMGSGADSAGTLGQNVFEKKSLVKI